MMMSQTPYVFPASGGSAAAFVSPLMDCTSMIHNADNIQNSCYQATPYAPAPKSAALAAFQQRLKAVAPAPRRHTHDPYLAVAADGSPIVAKLPFTSATSFRMSYRDEPEPARKASGAPPGYAGRAAGRAAEAPPATAARRPPRQPQQQPQQPQQQPQPSASVTHVGCKRVYVNGRPVTVWLREDGRAQ